MLGRKLSRMAQKEEQAMDKRQNRDGKKLRRGKRQNLRWKVQDQNV